MIVKQQHICEIKWLPTKFELAFCIPERLLTGLNLRCSFYKSQVGIQLLYPLADRSLGSEIEHRVLLESLRFCAGMKSQVFVAECLNVLTLFND